ncbi:MAG: PAS domain-containing sensor histidine kinase [Gemmatimonadota bacterium]
MCKPVLPNVPTADVAMRVTSAVPSEDAPTEREEPRRGPGDSNESSRVARETDGLYRLLVDSVLDYAIFALDATGHILSWNAGAKRLKGYQPAEIIGKHFSIFYPAEKIAEGFPQYELDTAAEKGRFEDEGWRVRKDGSLFWANVVLTALRDADGSLIGFAKVTRDLTERRAAEEALRESETRFRLLVTGVMDYAIFMLSPSGRIVTWNEGAERIKGYTAEEIVGQHMSIFYPPEDVAAGKIEHELEVASHAGKFEEEGIRIRKDGTPFWANVLITAIRNDDGELIGFAKVTRDLTERRAAHQKALEDARAIVAKEAARHAAEERARELNRLAAELRERSEALQARTKEAESANLAKSEFLAAMSHELRTPLNAIGGYAELLRLGISGSVNDLQIEQLERIRSSQQHLLAVINDILNYSRVEAGQIRYDIRPTSVCHVIENVSHMIAPQAQQKAIRFEIAPCDESLVAQVDSSKFLQILVNLLSNAMKFTPPGGSVSLTCEAGESFIITTIRDTGVGIHQDQLEAIFEPFVQVGRSLTSAHEGTGLGLSISRDLARAMDGDIRVSSVPGGGSSFTLRVPIGSAESLPRPKRRSQPH